MNHTDQHINSNHSAWKSWGKWTGIILGGLLLVGLLIRLSLMTNPVRQWAKNFALNQANSMLNGKLMIRSLEGDLGADWSAVGVELFDQQGDTLAKMDSLQVQYNMWALLDNTLEIQSLNVVNPNLSVQQDSTSWNLLRLIKEDTTAAPADTTPTRFSVSIAHWAIDNGDVAIRLQESFQPNQWRLKGLNSSGAAGYRALEPYLKLSNFTSL